MNSGARARACRRRAGDGALADPSICVWRRALRGCRAMNFPGAEDVSRALNRSDAAKTDQERFCPRPQCAVLTLEAISGFGPLIAACGSTQQALQSALDQLAPGQAVLPFRRDARFT